MTGMAKWIQSLLAGLMFLSGLLAEVDIITSKAIDSNLPPMPLPLCPANQYFHTQTQSCTACTKCTSFFLQISACNATHDAVCRCPVGTYRTVNGTCNECTKCPVGWGASPACTENQNTVCIQCPQGTYSNVNSFSRSCQSCTQCTTNEFPLHKCTNQQDTVCFRYQPKSDTLEADATKECEMGKDCEQQSRDNSYLYTAPLYCTLLGAIIVGLIIYVVLRRRINRKRSAANSTAISKKLLPPYQQITKQTAAPCLQHSPDAGPVVWLTSGDRTVPVHTPYCDLPSATRKSLQRGLSGDGSWLPLAGYLGFTADDIVRIQEKADKRTPRRSPSTVLLSDWSKRNYSTVGVLSHALASIHRMDLGQGGSRQSDNAHDAT